MKATVPIVIKDVVVADPSISVMFSTPTVINDFHMRFFLDQTTEDKKAFKLVADINVQKLPIREHYISLPFGDSLYEAGTKFNLIIEFQGQDPETGLPIHFTDNPKSLRVVSGGIIAE